MLTGAFSLSAGSRMSCFTGESPILRFSSPEDACIVFCKYWKGSRLEMSGVAILLYLLRRCDLGCHCVKMLQ